MQRLDEIVFQYQSKIKAISGIEKTTLKSNFIKNRHLPWSTGLGFEKFIEYISHVHQFGVNPKSTNRNQDIESYDLCALDYDALDGKTKQPLKYAQKIDALYDLELIKTHCFVSQPSLSYREDAQNTHFYFIFDRKVTSQAEFELIVKVLNRMLTEELRSQLKITDESLTLGFDNCVANNPGQVIFGSAHEPKINQKATLLDVNSCLSLAGYLNLKTSESTAKRSKHKSQLNSGQGVFNATPPESLNIETKTTESFINCQLMNIDNQPVINNKKTITEQVLDHFYQHLYKSQLGSDPRKLYNHTEEYQQRKLEDTDADNKVISRWEGINPFSDSNNSGTSFMIIETEGKLPRFWEKSGAFNKKTQRDFESVHGSFIDYQFEMNRDKYPGISVVNGRFPKGFFTKLIYDICDSYQIPRFAFYNDLLSLFYELLDESTERLKINDWESSKKERIYLLFIPELSIWKTYSENLLFHNYFNEALLKKAGSHQELDRLYKEWQESIGKKINKPLFSFFREWFQKNSTGKIDFLKKRPKINYNYTSLQNGLFDLRKKQFVDDIGQANAIDLENFQLPYNYYPVFDDHPVVVRFKNYLYNWIVNGSSQTDQYDAILSWLILCVKGMAYLTRNMVVLMGKNSGGKSTFANLINLILSGGLQNNQTNLHPSAKKYSATALINTDSHVTSTLEGARHLYVDELNSLPFDAPIEKLKDWVTSETDRTFSVNPKNEKGRMIDGYFAITATSEAIFKNKVSAGLDKRIKYINVDDSNMDLIDEVYFFSQRENTEVLFNWIINLDDAEWLKNWKTASSSALILNNMIEQKQESEPLCEFINSCFVITNSKDDFLDSNLAWQTFNAWKIEEACEVKFSSKQRFSLFLKRVFTEPQYGFNWTGSKKQNAEGVFGYCGVKLKTPNDNTRINSF